MSNNATAIHKLRQIDQELSQSENADANIIAGTEKEIIWATEPGIRSELSIVYIHGFSASRQEIMPACEQIASALGANLFYTRLTGHGLQQGALEDLSVETLLADTRQAFDIGAQIGERFIVIGNSTGVSLSTAILSSARWPTLAAFICLSPNFGLQGWRAQSLRWPGRQLWLKLFQGNSYEFTPQNNQQARYWSTCYPSRALLVLQDIIYIARNANLTRIHAPSLLMYCSQDKLLDISAMHSHFSQFGSTQKEVVILDSVGSDQQHIIAGDILSPETTNTVVDNIIRFIKNAI